MNRSYRYSTFLLVALACRAAPPPDSGSDMAMDSSTPSQAMDMGKEKGGSLSITARQARLAGVTIAVAIRSEEHTSELQSH